MFQLRCQPQCAADWRVVGHCVAGIGRVGRCAVSGGRTRLAALRATADGPPAATARAGTRTTGSFRRRTAKRGALGEQFVVGYERRRLREQGRGDLAGRVRWTASEDGDGLGYDVLSYDTDGHERHIEVKTTALGAEAPFYISSAELEFARRQLASYALHRVYAVQGDIPRFSYSKATTPSSSNSPRDILGLPARSDPSRRRQTIKGRGTDHPERGLTGRVHPSRPLAAALSVMATGLALARYKVNEVPAVELSEEPGSGSARARMLETP